MKTRLVPLHSTKVVKFEIEKAYPDGKCWVKVFNDGKWYEMWY